MLKTTHRLALACLAAMGCLAWAAAAGASVPTVGHFPAVVGPEVTPSSGSSSATCVFATARGLECWTPFQLSQAYDFPSQYDGTGQTIMIVDAYGSPHIASNLATFDTLFGIPGTPNLTIVNGPTVTTNGSGDLDGWGLETSLDVEYAHAMAPGAHIVLVQAASDDDANIAAALAQYIPQYPGAIVSQSFGEPEQDTGTLIAADHAAYAAGTKLKDTLLASAGDWGATFTPITGTTSPAIASYPASDPLVTSVGGTEGNPYNLDPSVGLLGGIGLNVNGAYGDEQVWNEGAVGVADAATGGAPSALFPAPPWQRPVSGYRTRTVPDVSYNAAILGGVDVIYTCQLGPADPAGTVCPTAGRTFQVLVGGTSAGSPQWASVFALVNQARGLQGKGPIGFANEALYKIGKQNKSAGDFHDITVGSDALDSPIGFDAAPGYDLASGWGTPDVAKLLPDLVNASAASNPDAGAPANLHNNNGTGHHQPHIAVPG